MSFPPDDDLTELLAGARAGRAESLDTLVRLVERPLVGFLRARGADDPDGTANEVLLGMCRHVGDFEGNASQFRAWVFTMARNRVIDEARRAARRPRSDPVDPSTLWSHSADREPVPGGHDLSRVEEMLASLTAEQQEVIVLRVIVGLSVEETARVTKRRPGAVRSLQHRALGHLRGNLSRKP